ncbi:MAG: PstS family phosphate ABC transporter substrate-binding protein [Sphingobacteriaceae bacterium]|nr:PstS family phosphate ABC transporter substrate-binding protein [Sphingobacteriaceae bacterium]
MNGKLHFTHWWWLLVLLAGLSGCGDQSYLRIDGSSTVFPITEAVTELYYKQAAPLRVVIGVSGTSGGMQKLLRGEIDICNASRAISLNEAAAFTAKNIELLEVPIAYDGIVIAVNKENNWAHDITVTELQQLWRTESQGKKIRWRDLRAAWPAQEIILFGPGAKSGTYDFFTSSILGKAGAGRGDYAASESDNILINGIKSNKGALGYFGYTYFKENTDQFKVLAVINDLQPGAQAVYPSPDNIKMQAYQPLTRKQFLYIRRAALSKPEVADFVLFYLQQLPALQSTLQFVPLPEAESLQTQTQLLHLIKSNEARKAD